MRESYLPGGQDAGDTGILYDDGEYIFFVNAAVDDGSRIAKLMNYFKTADPDDDSEGELSKRVRYLKKEEGGMDIMCEVSDRIMERGRKFGEEQLLHKQVQKKLAKGMNIADIAEALEETEARIREIVAEVTGEQKE